MYSRPLRVAHCSHWLMAFCSDSSLEWRFSGQHFVKRPNRW